MVQAGGHDGAELVGRQGGYEVEDGRGGLLVLQPEQQPQDLHPGKGIRLRQAEALQVSVDGQLDIFSNDSHIVFPSQLM